MALTACSPLRPITSGGLFLVVVGIILLSAALGLPEFLVATDAPEGSSFTLGAFQIKLTGGGMSLSSNIDKDCDIELSSDPSVTTSLDNCTAFNTFRGLLVMGTTIGFVYMLLSLFVLFTLRTSSRIWRLITLVLGCSAVGCFGVSMFSIIGWKNDDSSSFVFLLNNDYGASFKLQVSGGVLFFIGVIGFFIGNLREGREAAQTALLSGAGYQQFNDQNAQQTPYQRAEAAQPGYASYAQGYSNTGANTGYP